MLAECHRSFGPCFVSAATPVALSRWVMPPGARSCKRLEHSSDFRRASFERGPRRHVAYGAPVKSG